MQQAGKVTGIVGGSGKGGNVFTGIIESMGTLLRVEARGLGRVFHLRTDLDLGTTRLGDSIAVNGACLTAVQFDSHGFSVDVSPETVEKTTFKDIRPGALVNLERAMQLGARIDGHLVSGHVDGIGTIASITRDSNAMVVDIQVKESLAAEMIQKGSVAVDGISLTINQCSGTGFQVSIIPHTGKVTTLMHKRPGDQVNIETDMLGKYVRKALAGMGAGKGASLADPATKDLSLGLLARQGFL